MRVTMIQGVALLLWASAMLLCVVLSVQPAPLSPPLHDTDAAHSDTGSDTDYYSETDSPHHEVPTACFTIAEEEKSVK